MGEVDLSIPMEMFTKENGRTIKLTEEEFIIIMMGLVTQENGLRTFRRVMEFRNGMMGHLSKGNFFNDIV